MRLVRRHPFVLLLVVLSLIAVALLLASGSAVWQAAHTDDARRVDHADLIAVLGAAEYNGRPSPVFAGRLEQAALLYRERFAPLVIVLGGNRPGDMTTEGAAGRHWLIEHGVPTGSVYAVPVGNDTWQSVRAAVAFMRERRLGSVFLVSDPWHNLRIRRMASDLGVRAYVSATWHSAAVTSWTRFEGYVRETFAYVRYRTLGY